MFPDNMLHRKLLLNTSCENIEKYNIVPWQWCHNMAIYHRKMQHILPPEFLYINSKDCYSSIFHILFFLQDGTKGPWSQIWWESFCGGGEVEKNNSKLKGKERERNRMRRVKRTSTSCTERILFSHSKVERWNVLWTARFNNLNFPLSSGIKWEQ